MLQSAPCIPGGFFIVEGGWQVVDPGSASVGVGWAVPRGETQPSSGGRGGDGMLQGFRGRGRLGGQEDQVTMEGKGGQAEP